MPATAFACVAQRNRVLLHGYAYAHLALIVGTSLSVGVAAGFVLNDLAHRGRIEVDESPIESVRYNGSRRHHSPVTAQSCDSAKQDCLGPLFAVNAMNIEAALQQTVGLLKFLTANEGTSLVAFLDTVAKPPVWTIGHGTTRINGQPVHQGMTCTEEEADRWAMEDMRSAAKFIAGAVKVPLTDNQFGALISFTYNEGVGTFFHSSVLEALNKGLYGVAADRLLEYDIAGGKKVRGLDTRRGRERALFLRQGGSPTRIASIVAPAVAHPLSDADRLNQEQIDHLKA